MSLGLLRPAYRKSQLQNIGLKFRSKLLREAEYKVYSCSGRKNWPQRRCYTDSPSSSSLAETRASIRSRI